ncbi:flagellar hook-basal body complex protein FliE [Bacillus hwajinpoensis]|uniref:Flagellar hook-basal body complex protein FliE n=1 Tax=Guptibacillus hwajinpoensis TaxID=208199 RepID=A0A845ERK6_9BACL|nr:flagellar hook-basal body complex protein FliE [Pseudalkalibacillus hwajinpoensis]MYL62452.1 flagellar hook-basal body complex protein FliE [Pseudalkalibacillus hwajinpoensis]
MNTISALQQLPAQAKSQVSSGEATADFGQMLQNAINQVNDNQVASEQMTNKLVTGEVQDVHEVMLAAQKASLSLNLTVEVRNKVIESYQEIMRMQM